MAARVRIRRFEAGDDDVVREIHERTMRDADAYLDPADLPPDVNPDADLDAIASYYLDSGGEFLLVERGGEAVGTGAVRPVTTDDPHPAVDGGPDQPTAEITRMRVLPAHQGEGIGARLLAELEERARERGYRVFVLDTLARLDAARALYESRGYTGVGRETRGGLERVFYRRVVEPGG